MNIKKLAISVSALLLTCLSANSTAQVKQQEATLLVYNVAFGGLTGGIGSIINKPKTSSWHRAFVRGFWQGSLGGTLNYTSKKTLYLVNRNQNAFYTLPASLLNAAAFSIVEGAARQTPFLQHWSMDYGFVRIDFSTKSKTDFKARLLPLAIYATIDISRYGKFDLKTTLLSGTIVFKTTESIVLPNAAGFSSGRAFVYSKTNEIISKHEIIAHEMVHYFQFREYQILNSWLLPTSNRIKAPKLKTLFEKYIYLDIPYFWPFYHLEGVKPHPYYNRNFYEFEAQRFSTNAFVPIY